jgi:fluoride exporter
MMIWHFAIVGLGGGLGAMLRFAVGHWGGKLWGFDFPYGTLLINVLGCFLMGVLIESFARVWQPTPAMRLFLTAGVLGGFTTFSTFSLDALTLWQRGEEGAAALYVMASVSLSLMGVGAGLWIVKRIVE